jgi:hypothetical protein
MDSIPDRTDLLRLEQIRYGGSVSVHFLSYDIILQTERFLDRFFERIAKTYRREKWGSMLRPLLATWYACTQQLGAIEISVRLLIEMLGHGKCHHIFDIIE